MTTIIDITKLYDNDTYIVEHETNDIVYCDYVHVDKTSDINLAQSHTVVIVSTKHERQSMKLENDLDINAIIAMECSIENHYEQQ